MRKSLEIITKKEKKFTTRKKFISTYIGLMKAIIDFPLFSTNIIAFSHVVFAEKILVERKKTKLFWFSGFGCDSLNFSLKKTEINYNRKFEHDKKIKRS